MKFCICIVLFPFFIYGDGLSEGQSLASTANQKNSDIKQGGAGQLGFSIQERPKEVGYYNGDTLSQKASAQKASEDYVHIKDSYNAMEEEVVEPYDPFQGNQKTVRTRQVKKTVEKTCDDGGESFTQTCQKNRVIKLILTPEIRSTRYSCPGHWVTVYTCANPLVRDVEGCSGGEDELQFCNPGCQVNSIVTQERSVSVDSDQWVGCEDMEALGDTPQESLSIDVVSQTFGPSQTRYLEARCPTKVEQEAVYRDSWEKTYTYLMQPKKCVQCQAYLDAGCRLKESKCIKEMKTAQGLKLCTKWRKTFSCEEVQTVTDDLSDLKSSNLIKPITSTSNQNMYKALAQLEGLKQVAKHMEGNPVASIFKGIDARCSINFGGAFKNCCLKDGGWGSNSGLGTKCSADEETLKKAKHDKRCVYIGTRVKKKVAGVVLSKEQVHCCYPSKIARAIQEGARRQLGFDFGSVDAPNCRGLTPNEMERVDFGNLDLSDAFSDIAESATKMTRELQRDFEKKKTSINTKETQERFAKQQQTKGAINGQSF